MKPEVKIGQVWKHKYKQPARYILIDSLAMKDGEVAVWGLPCDAAGALLFRGSKAARIKLRTIHARCELIALSVATRNNET